MIFRKARAWPAVLVFAAAVLAAAAPARAEPGFTGLHIQGMDPMFANALGLNAASGVLVRDVALGSPAAMAGVQRGDLIIGFDGKEIRNVGELVSMANETSPGETHTMTVQRAGGEEAELTLNLTKRPVSLQIETKDTGLLEDHGLTMVALTQQMRNNLSLRWSVAGVGVTVVDDPSEPGFKTDMRRGEVIVQVNQRDVWLPRQVIDAYNEAKAAGRKSIMLLVDGERGLRFSVLTIPQE